jgi:5-formyltetrahydrofolate cyclo-ligase
MCSETHQNWKRQQRTVLRRLRQKIVEEQRNRWSEAITVALIQGFPILGQQRVGFYWPHQGEYDPMPAMTFLKIKGATLALPEVVSKNKPLRFIEWWPKAPMKKDAYGIPVPDNTKEISIDAAVIPMLGFDEQGYRLGYGSGYFDRTLAAMNPRPLSIGVAFEILRLPTIYPHRYDIAMDYVVTEKSIFYRTKNGLEPLSITACAARNIVE